MWLGCFATLLGMTLKQSSYDSHDPDSFLLHTIMSKIDVKTKHFFLTVSSEDVSHASAVRQNLCGLKTK